MRKLFLTVIAVSAAMTLVLGVAFAWTSSATNSYTATAGSLSVAIANDSYTGNQVYPTASWINVVNGQIKNNTLANPGVNVFIAGGAVTGTGNFTYCHMAGNLRVIDGSQVAPGGNVGGWWGADLAMAGDSPNDCQGATIGYDVRVDVSTP